jgi:hypothetical protein
MANFRTKRPANTYVAESRTVAQRGLFATRPIKRHRYLGIYPGTIKYGHEVIDESEHVKLFQIASSM